MSKETRLNDKAAIYEKREKQTEKQKLSEMNNRDRIQYFKDYYFKKLIIGGIFSGFVIWLLVTIFSPKIETVLYAAIINDFLETEKTDALTSDLNQYYSINPKKQNIFLDTNFHISTESSSPDSSASQERLATYVYAEQIDVIIADASIFKAYAYSGYFIDLADQLPTDLYSYLSDSIYMSDTDYSTEQNAYGIYLTDCEKYENLGTVIENPVIGILANSKHRKNGANFIKYLYDFK